MISMKMSKKERKDVAQPVDMLEEEYPWGLEVSLDDESLKKLGMTALPEMGTEMTLVAKVKVRSRSENENDRDSEPHRNLGLQITDMELKTEAESKTDKETFYGKD